MSPPPPPPPLLVEVGFLGCRWNKNFWKPHRRMRYRGKFYFCGIKPMNFQGHTPLCPVKETVPFLSSARLDAKPLPRVPTPDSHSSVQHLFPAAGHCVWGLHGQRHAASRSTRLRKAHRSARREQSKGNKREGEGGRENSLGILCSQIFTGLHGLQASGQLSLFPA